MGGEISKAASSVPDNGFQPRPRPLLLLKSLSLLFLQTQSPCLRARKISLAGEAVSSHPSSSFPELRWVPVAQSLLLRLNLSSAAWLGRTRQGRETGGRRGRIRLYSGCTGRWGRITCHSLPGMPRMWTRVEAKETMVGGRHNSYCGGHMHSAGDHDPLYIKRGGSTTTWKQPNQGGGN